MNIFRLLGDLLHLASIVILLLKIRKTKSCAGISFSTQLLYAVIFCTRYLDLFTHYVSLYNTLMKLFFIGTSVYVVYLMEYQFKGTNDRSLDTFKIEYLLGPAAVLALLFHYKFTVLEVLWSFSVFLEAVAIMPQLFLIQRTGEAETITTHYIFALGAYRALYLVNWIYRLATEDHYRDWIAWIAGIVQTGLYIDFFYIYFTKVLRGKRFELPV